MIGDGFGEEGFTSAGSAVEDDAFGWFNAHFFVKLRVQEGEFDGFADFLDLGFETANVCVGFRGGFVEFHDGDERVGVVSEDAND